MLKKSLLTLALAAAFVGSTAVAAQAAMTMTLGQPDLSGRVSIALPVTVSCSPFDPSLTMEGASIVMNVEQAAGQHIAYGTGYVYLPPDVTLFACDDTAYAKTATVTANTAGAPFHGGSAVFAVTASAGAGTPCPWSPTNCFTSPFASQTASTTQTLNMH
jgi:hypothetical protein